MVFPASYSVLEWPEEGVWAVAGFAAEHAFFHVSSGASSAGLKVNQFLLKFFMLLIFRKSERIENNKIISAFAS